MGKNNTVSIPSKDLAEFAKLWVLAVCEGFVRLAALAGQAT